MKKASRAILVACSLLLLAPNFVAAVEPTYSDGVGGFIGNSYFENAYVGNGANYDWIYRNAHGSYSITGSVMPNWQTGSTGGGGGAVGTKALGVASSESNSQVLKEALYDYLYRSNTNQLHAAGTAAGQWDRMGSAVVVHTMLGDEFNDAGRDRSRTISAEDWADLKARLVDNTEIQMTRQYYNARENTAGIMVGPGGNTFDAARYTYEPGNIGIRDSWVFRDGSGAIVYVMEIICANPLGNFAGLPDNPVPTSEYTLTPTASIDKTVVEPDDSVTVTNTVTNNGVDPSGSTLWRLTKMIYDPGTTLNVNDKASRDSANDSCGSFVSGGRSACDTVQEMTDAVFNPGVPRTFDPLLQYTVPVDMPVGTKVCFTTSVSRPTQEASPVWRHSTLQCITVGKKPKLQVWGGDVRSGGKIETSISTITSLNTTYGSWGEYGALSKKNNSGFASGSGLNNGSGNPAQSSWSNLTFANTGSDITCQFGCYDFTLTSSGLVGQFVSQASQPVLSGTVNLNDLASGTYKAGDVTLSGTTVGAGKTVILVSTGTVTIEGSITYEDIEYTSIRDIPQVIVRAPAINIRNGATQVDAWLLAVANNGAGVLNTCSDVGVADNLTANICNNRLVINGPVVADSVYLRRTAGSDSAADQRGVPAEIFNLRADAYLWANAYGSGSSRVQTVYTKELSPRF